MREISPALLLLLLVQIPNAEAENAVDLKEFTKRGNFSLDPSNLDLFFFRAAVSALFKAKAASILHSLPDTERVVFRQCESDSDGRLNLLAKCLVSLFNVRDYAVEEESRTKVYHFGNGLVEMPSWEWLLSKQFMNIQKSGMETETRKISMKANDLFERNMKQTKGPLNEAIKEEALQQKVESNLAKNFALFKALANERSKTRRRPSLREFERFREKREIPTEQNFLMTESKMLQWYPNVQKLLRVERFYRLVEYCNNFIHRKDEQSSRLFRNAHLPIRLATEAFQRNPLLAMAETQLKDTVHFDKLSILSPKLLSILPEKSANASSALLSPTFLSFHEQGDFSLPYLLKLVFTNNGKETLPWLDLLLQISGASATLEKLQSILEPSIREIEEKVYPAIQRLEELDKRFKRLLKTMAVKGGQREEMEAIGYTFLDAEQSRLMGIEGKDDTLDDLDREELDAILEQDIRAIAKIADDDHLELPHRRSKRFLSTAQYGQVRMLNPFFFLNQIEDSAILRRVAVSPKAFSAEILTADFFRFDVLSPEAFVASILSPRAAIAHILSPTAFMARVLAPQAIMAEVLNPKAFDAKVLSPRAFTALVLSPRMLVTEILTPKAFELRILNPTTLSFSVLTIIGAAVLSPVTNSVLVLSPSILTPGFLSPSSDSENIKILSPQILG